MTIRGLKDDINDLYRVGAKFVVITDTAIPVSAARRTWHGPRDRASGEAALGDAQCFDAAPDGAKINDWYTR